MTPKKKYFKTPLVRAEIGRIRFPKICPVCASPTTKTTLVSMTPGRKRYLSASWDPVYIVPRLRKEFIKTQETIQFSVPVCDCHNYIDEAEWRYKTLCLISDGLCGVAAVFAYLVLGWTLWHNYPIPLWVMGMIALFAVFMVLTKLAFRPNPFQRSFSIVGFDAGVQNVLFKFKSKSYRRAFIKQNPMTSELINWIVIS